MDEISKHIAYELVSKHEPPRSASEMWRAIAARTQYHDVTAAQHRQAEAESETASAVLAASRRVSL